MNRLTKVKSTATLLRQQERIWKLLLAQTKHFISEAHPETGGNMLLANNWGNEKAKALVRQFYERCSRNFNILKVKYKIAFALENPEHVTSDRILAEYNIKRETRELW
ncbi:MAG: hypothetical protein ABJH04_08195 [Cyclobacteriaceae bacterium]